MGSGSGVSVSLGRLQRLDYAVAAWSSYSSGYKPEHVLEHKPHDQASRWSSASNDQNQFLVLGLREPALVETITFGKFYKNHVCNLREFKVFVGSSVSLEDCRWTSVLHSGLRNDSLPECFPLQYPAWKAADGVSLPHHLIVRHPIPFFHFECLQNDVHSLNPRTLLLRHARKA